MRKAGDLTSIGSLLKSGLFAIPAYQRDYAWTPTNCAALAEDIFRIAEGSHESHFLGSIVVMQLDPAFKATSQQGDPERIETTSEVNIFHVVDGQQRLTSCSLFLCALRDELQDEEESQFDQERGPRSKTGILNLIDKHLFDDEVHIGGDFAPRLFLNNDPSIQYSNCLFNSNITSNGRKLSNAYSRYRELIRKNREERSSVDAVEYYTSIRNAILNQLKVDDIYCDDFGSAFQIFESINAKGLPLTSVDLIKCFLMQKSKSNVEDAHKKWNKLQETVGSSPDDTTALDRFMLAFLFTEKGERVSKRKAYDIFKSIYEDKEYEDIFNELQTAAEYYRALALDKDSWGDDDPRRAFKVLGLTSIYVPLLAFARNSQNGASDPELKTFEKSLLPFAIRYQICGQPSNALDGPFSKMISDAKNSKKATDAFEHIKPLMPSDERFRDAFEELTFPDSKEPLATYLLEQIETFLERKKGSSKRLPESRTLEHIIPKEYTEYVEEWGDLSLPDGFETEIIRSIGNLALIEKPDNSAASNRPYSEKVQCYKEGHKNSETSPEAGFNLLKLLSDKYPTSFEVQDVNERAKYLADRAVIIWEEA